MRTLPGILLSVITAAAIAISAVLVASHFGMRDWPTPPMPDTATRLITPTEAAGKVREQITTSGDDPIDVPIASDRGSSADRRPAGVANDRAGRARRDASRTGKRRSGRQASGRRSGGKDRPPRGGDATGTGTEDTDDTQAEDDAQATPSPEAPAEALPVTPAGADQQARADDSTTAEPVAPAVPDLSVVPAVPAPGEDEDDAGKGHGHKGDRHEGDRAGRLADDLLDSPR